MKRRMPLFFAVLAFGLAALACKVSLSSANIKDAWTARNEAGDQRTTTFEQNETVYVKVELTGAPDDTKVKAAFSTVDVEGDEDNKAIDAPETTGGSGTMTFTLSNTKLWPAGKYKVEIYLNDKVDRTLNYEVKASQAVQPTVAPPPTQAAATALPTQPGGGTTAAVTDAFMARDENGKDPTTHFKPTEVVYTLFTLEAPQGAHLKAVWVAKDTQGNPLDTVIEELPFDMQSSGQNWVSYTPDANKPMSPGKYQVQFYVGDALSRTVDFTVEDVSSAPGATAVTGGFMAFDENGSSPATVFGTSDIFYCIVNFNAPNGATIKAEWYAVDTADAKNYYFDSYETQVTGTDSTWFSLSPTSVWSVGTYRVDIYLNGEYATSFDFEVR